MDTLDILEEIKEDIGGQFITDENLRKWASQLTEAIYESEDIAQEAGYTINALLYECKQENFRAGCSRSKMHNEILFGRYFNLLKFVIDSLNIENREEVFEHCRNVIYGTNEQSQQKTLSNEAKESQQMTEREKKYFAKAIEAGLMQEAGTGYEWLYNNGSKASLAYFLQKVFNPDGTCRTPFKRLESMFNKKSLAVATNKLLEVVKNQKWRGEIDKLFR